jgi:hypothetical protein
MPPAKLKGTKMASTKGVDISKGLERIERAEEGHRRGEVSSSELRAIRQSSMRGFTDPKQQPAGKKR